VIDLIGVDELESEAVFIAAEPADLADENLAIGRDVPGDEILERSPGEFPVDGAIPFLTPVIPRDRDRVVDLFGELAVVVPNLGTVADPFVTDDVRGEEIEEVFRDGVVSRELAAAGSEES